jgi:hypothetical protein
MVHIPAPRNATADVTVVSGKKDVAPASRGACRWRLCTLGGTFLNPTGPHLVADDGPF